MKSFDIALYGHLSYDRIFDGFKEINSVGCIGNVWLHLTKLDPSLKVHIGPSALGEAIIYVDSVQAKRASIANLNLRSITRPTIVPSKWHHALYINCLPHDPSWMDEIPDDEILSADVCKGVPVNLSHLSRVDYLFISDEDKFHTMSELTSATKGWVIMHHKAGSICSNGHNTFEVSIEPISGVNVLGAGDMLAATIICARLKNRDEALNMLITRSHEEVKQCLRRKQTY